MSHARVRRVSRKKGGELEVAVSAESPEVTVSVESLARFSHEHMRDECSGWARFEPTFEQEFELELAVAELEGALAAASEPWEV